MHLRSLKSAKSNRQIWRGAFKPAPILLLTLLASAFSATHARDARAQDRAADRWDRCAAFGPDFAPVESSDHCARVSGHVRVPFGPNSGWGAAKVNEALPDGFLPTGPASANFKGAPRSIETPSPQERVLLRPRTVGGL
jgi:hypothetical protein